MAGVSNIRKDAMAEAVKHKRRQIMINKVVLLRHAIATNQMWNEMEKCLRWSCMAKCFWSGFCRGKLLEAKKSKFNPASSLLPSDIMVRDRTMAIWIRSPSVYRQGGDVVEV